MATSDFNLRVSVATLNRVVFPSPRDGALLLAMERKATLLDDDDGRQVYVRAHPFGGAVRLYDANALRALVGDFRFDSERSRAEQDFRILIRQTDWEAVKQFCLGHLRRADGVVLESDPRRELVEEFDECLQVDLQPRQYAYQPIGFIVENNPTPTDNAHSRGVLTVRIYRTFEVRIIDEALCRALVAASDRNSDDDLRALALKDALNGGRGRVNTVLALPLHRIHHDYRAIPPQQRYGGQSIAGHLLDSSVPAILEDVDVPQFESV